MTYNVFGGTLNPTLLYSTLLIRSKKFQIMHAVPKFKKSAPGPNHAPFGSIWSLVRCDLPRSIRIPNLTFLLHHSRFMEGGLKFKKNWGLDPDHATFGGILSLVRWDLPRSIHTPNFEVFSFTRARFTKGRLKLNSIINHALLGYRSSALGVSHVMRYINLRYLLTYLLYFVMLQMGLTKAYSCTVFEVSSFIHFRFTEWV